MSRLTLSLLAACAVYTPAPVRPDSQLEGFNGRRLDDPGLLSWLDSLGVGGPASTWTPRQLALAASWFRPERDRRLAEVGAADAALVTAGARPAPGVSSDLEYAFSDPQADSRWGVALAGLFTLELGGKRGARRARARGGALAARARAAESEWEQAVRVYRVSFAWHRAARLLEAAQDERAVLDSAGALALARYEGGTLTRLELARFETERRAALATEQAAAREELLARAALAEALAVPVAAVEAVGLADGVWSGCGDPSEPRAALQREALAARWSIRRAAAEYQVAEGDLRIEVANAAPDLSLGPGMFFDQGTGKFTLAAALPGIPLGRNRGPIGEAEARRRVAGARLAEEQERVLGEVDASLAGCDAAAREAAVADSLVAEAASRAGLVEAAYARGEAGRLEVALSAVELSRARRLALESGFRRAEAGLNLERAVGAWGRRGDGPWPEAALPGAARRTEP